jgi:hypothetical protein
MDIDLDWQRRNGGELVRDALEKGKATTRNRIPRQRDLI